MINSTLDLFEELVNGKDAPLIYLLTYKLSQDNLELFFSAVRRMNGWNNNTSVLTVVTQTGSSALLESRKCNFTTVIIDVPDHDYCFLSHSDVLSPFDTTTFTYISGFFGYKLFDNMQ